MTAAIDVSVVIPSYNREQFIARAVHSVLAQEGCALEVIVVDDASTDTTVAAVQAIEDSRIRIVRLDRNRGAAAARNAGVRAATAPYIAFLDSDDYWLPEKLKTQIQLAKRQRRDDWAIYNAGIWNWRGRDIVSPRRAFDPAQDELSTYLVYERNFMPTSGFFLPTSVALRFPFDETLPLHEDFDLTLTLHDNGITFLFCPALLVRCTSESGATRLSTSLNAEPTIRWLNKRWVRLSRPARAELAVGLIFRKLLLQRPMLALKYLVIGVANYPPIVLSLAFRLLRATVQRAGRP